MKIEKDGSMYCVKADNFVDLQKSEDYFFIDKTEWRDFLGRMRKGFVSDLICQAQPYYGENNDLEDHYIITGKMLDALLFPQAPNNNS